MAASSRRKPRIEAQTWRNVSPYPAVTLYRALYADGSAGQWFRYRENAEARNGR